MPFTNKNNYKILETTTTAAAVAAATVAKKGSNNYRNSVSMDGAE